MTRMNDLIIRLASATDTERFGEIIGRSLRNGDVLSLDGEPCVGKTTMTRGICPWYGDQDAREPDLYPSDGTRCR